MARLKIYNNLTSTWEYVDGSAGDHSLLSNLTSGDPHTQYLLSTGARTITGDQKITQAKKLIFDTDGHSYIWCSAADIMEFWTSAAKALTINASGTLTIPATTRYYAVSPGSFTSSNPSANTGQVFPPLIRSNSNTVIASMVTGVNLPHGSTITSVKAYWFRNHASAAGWCYLYRCNNSGDLETTMAEVHSNSTAGDHTVTNAVITNPIIDNSTYTYGVIVDVDPNTANTDVEFYGLIITYTTTSLP